MATVTEPSPAIAAPIVPTPSLQDLARPCRVGPDHHGRRMSFEDFIAADFEDGWLYELTRGVVVVTRIPGPHHGLIVYAVDRLFVAYDLAHPGLIKFVAGGGECRLRLPGMQSDRHPDKAVYLTPPPEGPDPWTRWIPEIVVEVVSIGGEERDYAEKREEYLRAGVREYWILNPKTRILHALRRAGDVWDEKTVTADEVYRTTLLPGLEVRPGRPARPCRGALGTRPLN